MSEQKLKYVQELLSLEKSKEAQDIFNEIQPAESVLYYYTQGLIEQKFQNWSKAINAFSKVLKLDPENVEAQNNLHIIQNILNFWNPEMFNP